jgi:hypothetical protein
MSAGDPWLLPGGHKAIEMQGSTDDVLQLRVIKPPRARFAQPRQALRHDYRLLRWVLAGDAVIWVAIIGLIYWVAGR